MSIRDLRSKIIKKKETTLDLFRSKKSKQLLLLTDKRSWKQIQEERDLTSFFQAKRNNNEFFKIYQLALNYVERKISTTRNINVPPFYPKRGSKGFLLNDRDISLFDLNRQKTINNVIINLGSKITLIGESLYLLPTNTFRFLKE